MSSHVIIGINVYCSILHFIATLAFGILIEDYINYVSKKSAKSFVNNVWHNAGTQVKVVKIRHFYSRLRII